MTDDASQRFFNMAETYDRMAPRLVPQYDFLQDEAVRLIPFDRDEAITIVDLGAGSGRLLERALERYPAATCYWVDYSDDFLRVAQQRLARYDGRVRYVLRRIEEDWESGVDGPAHAILSMSAIHHLDSEGKRRLYGRCFEALRPGGVFVNTDEMKTVYEDAYRANLEFWVAHSRDARGVMAGEDLPYYDQWSRHFASWIARNVGAPPGPKQPGDDIHDGFVEQLEWLREAGFRGVELFAKYRLWCMIGGYR